MRMYPICRLVAIATSVALMAACAGVSQRMQQAAQSVQGASARAGTAVVVDNKLTGQPASQSGSVSESVTTIAEAACGQDLACVEGFDLRVRSVQAPIQNNLLPVGEVVPVTAVIENRGRRASPVTEAYLCIGTGGSPGFYCQEGTTSLVTLPKLTPGERVRVRTGIEIPEAYGTHIVIAIDPDEITGDRDRTNNVGETDRFEAELPTLRFLNAEVVDAPVPARGPYAVRITLRNTSVTATSPSTDLEIGFDYLCGETEPRVEIPALAPRQVYEVTIRLYPNGVDDACDSDHEARLFLDIDPDFNHEWGNTSRDRSMSLEYEVR